MNRRTAALAAILTLVALSVAGAYMLRPDRAPALRFTADFDNAVGLYTGNEVAVLGMPVGRVTSPTG